LVCLFVRLSNYCVFDCFACYTVFIVSPIMYAIWSQKYRYLPIWLKFRSNQAITCISIWFHCICFPSLWYGFRWDHAFNLSVIDCYQTKYKKKSLSVEVKLIVVLRLKQFETNNLEIIDSIRCLWYGRRLACPWNLENYLLIIGFQAVKIKNLMALKIVKTRRWLAVWKVTRRWQPIGGRQILMHSDSK
jgi:hypothetical protein